MRRAFAMCIFSLFDVRISQPIRAKHHQRGAHSLAPGLAWDGLCVPGLCVAAGPQVTPGFLRLMLPALRSAHSRRRQPPRLPASAPDVATEAQPADSLACHTTTQLAASPSLVVPTFWAHRRAHEI
jgi:hypothetical protein